MIISNKYKFIWFFPVCHTASTSLFMSLRTLHDDIEFGNATFASESQIFYNTTCFTATQEGKGRASPLPGMVLLNKHTEAKGLLQAGFDKKKFKKYLKIAVCRDPYTWVGSQSRKHNNQPAEKWYNSRWARSAATGQVPLLADIDRVIKYEQLQIAFDNLKKELKIEEDISLIRVRKKMDAPDYDYLSYHTPSSIKFINEIYSQDFEQLGYEKILENNNKEIKK